MSFNLKSQIQKVISIIIFISYVILSIKKEIKWYWKEL